MKTMATPRPEPKVAKFHVLDRDTDPDPHEHLDTQRQSHAELDGAEIRLCWLIGQKADKDGRLVLGKAIKAPPLWQQATGIDWFIGLNRDYWLVADSPQRDYLVDHELCHMAQQIDAKTGDQVEDDHGFLQWRTVKHDIEEFYGPVERHGLRMGDLHRFFEVARKAQARLPFTSTGAEVEAKVMGPIERAMETLRPEPGSSIGAVSISVNGGEPLELSAEDKARRGG